MRYANYIRTRLSEAPIGDISFHGGSEASSMRADDIGIVRSPKAQAKIRRVLEKAPVEIDLAFVNYDSYAPEVRSRPRGILFHNGRVQQGFVDPAVLKELIGIDLVARPDAVLAAFISNEGDGRLPLTPWIIGHRICHMLYTAYENGYKAVPNPIAAAIHELNVISEQIYTQKKLHNIAPNVRFDTEAILMHAGKFKSAREGSVGDLGEFACDCFAQFCIQGSITFNSFKNVSVPQAIMRRARNKFLREPNNMYAMAKSDKTHKNYIDDRGVFPNRETTPIDDVFGEVVDSYMAKWATDAQGHFTTALQGAIGKMLVL